jgi:hypothetical protein
LSWYGVGVARALDTLIANGIELQPHPDVDNDLPAGVGVPIDATSKLSRAGRSATGHAPTTSTAILGHPDESWSTDDLPIIAEIEGGAVVCQSIALPNGYGGRGIQVMSDDDDLRRLATLIEGTHDRQKILDIDPETHTALVIHGVASADQVARARIQELASPPGANPKYLLDLTIEGLRWTPAVVVAIDKLPQRPTEAVLRHPGAGATPTPFSVYG